MRVLTFLFLVVLFLGFSSCKENQQSKKDEVKIEFSNYTGELSFGTIQRIDSFPSKFVGPRTVDVWLPENYSENENHAVLYMHDGQMLFDAETTWNKQEWKVDEIIGGLILEGKIKNIISSQAYASRATCMKGIKSVAKHSSEKANFKSKEKWIKYIVDFLP